MNDNKNARPTVGAAGQAERESHLASGNSHNDCTTCNGPISSLLMHGQENGLHLSDLTKMTGRTEREVRMMIHSERRRGVPILSNNRDGYFLPGSDAERAQCVKSLRHRANEILKAAMSIETAGDIEESKG